MNLNAIVAPIVAAVNPPMLLTIQQSTSYTTEGDGAQVPIYGAPQQVWGSVQALQYNDIQQIDGLNIQGERRAIYLQGNWQGVVRADQRGGDLITFPDSSVWLVVFVFEDWNLQDGWVKVCATRQMGV